MKLVDDSGAICRRALMREAHRAFRLRGPMGWTWGEALKWAWARAREAQAARRREIEAFTAVYGLAA